jgi:hypothetical protein
MKTHNLQKYTWCILLLLIIGVYSCKSTKRITQADSALEDKTSSELFKDILFKGLEYKTFSSKLNMTISTGTKTLSSKGSLRIVNNEAILLSVQPLFGIEMFRLYVEPEHIIILDRMNKRYVKESFEDIKGKNPVGFNFYTLQSLFTNNLFIPEKSSVSLKDYKTFRYSEGENNYILAARDKKSNIDYTFSINGNDQITLTELNMPANQYSLQWNYDQFTLMNNLFFPYEMKIVASTQKRNLNTNISLSSISLNESLSLDTSIPDSYTKVELKDVLKMLADKK